MHLDLEAPGGCNLYSLATHIVLPRPIAWVMTTSRSGQPNLAPFSYFGLVADDPILMFLSVGRRNGVPKDTARNLLEQGEAVIHVVEAALLEPMVLSSKEFGAHQNEVEYAGLTATPCARVAPPRLEAASIALECRVDRHLEVGADLNDLFFLRAVYAHVKDEALRDGLPDPKLLRVVGKLGASDYAVTDAVTTFKRP